MRALKKDTRRYVNIYKIEEMHVGATTVKYAHYEDGNITGAAPLTAFELDPMDGIWIN